LITENEGASLAMPEAPPVDKNTPLDHRRCALIAIYDMQLQRLSI